MKIAVVILNWNGKELLEKFLPSVTKYSNEAQIYVADNASTDDSVAFLQQFYPQIKIIKNTSNFGFAQGYNQALKHVDAEIFALVNSDIEVTENWLQPIIAEFENDATTSIIQPKILDYKRKSYFEYAGAAGGYIDRYGYPFCRGRIFDTVEEDLNQFTNAPIFWASGACMFIRSKVFTTLNGFDGDFFAHMEEIDLCWRAFNTGHQSKFVAQSVVYHVGGATLAAGNPRKTFLNFRNSLLMLHKNLPQQSVYLILLIRMLLDGLAGIKFLFEAKPKHTWAIVRAHFDFYRMFSNNKLKRSSRQRQDYYRVKNLTFQYFVSHNCTYNKLI